MSYRSSSERRISPYDISLGSPPSRALQRVRMDSATKKRLARAIGTVPKVHERGTGGSLVAECVRRLVFDGHLRRADPLPQEDLAEILGLSRIPVRDGLMLLEANGWVVVHPGYGASVNGLDRAFVEDHMSLMGSIWTLFLGRVVDPASRAHLQQLAADVGTATDANALQWANRTFLDALVLAANTPRIASLFHNASPLVPGNIFAVIPGASDLQRGTVPMVADALHRGATDRASSLAVEHHRGLGSLIVELLTERGVLEPR